MVFISHITFCGLNICTTSCDGLFRVLKISRIYRYFSARIPALSNALNKTKKPTLVKADLHIYWVWNVPHTRPIIWFLVLELVFGCFVSKSKAVRRQPVLLFLERKTRLRSRAVNYFNIKSMGRRTCNVCRKYRNSAQPYSRIISANIFNAVTSKCVARNIEVNELTRSSAKNIWNIKKNIRKISRPTGWTITLLLTTKLTVP